MKKEEEHDLLSRARTAIHCHLKQEKLPPAKAELNAKESKGVFVTLWLAGNLRGCIGHLEPRHQKLIMEIEQCAVLAATNDPRFSPVSIEELNQIKIDLSILNQAEPVRSETELDPLHFGVIVEQGMKRGTLLPAIEGIEDSKQQVRIAAEKAGIDLRQSHQLYRYQVIKLTEVDDGT
ncbi:MAG: AmmeMemoRadiSam system protein A [Zetaproteobacteria bacterium]|nr:AmmeMemoRadiSam system protein A [Pseudobdellovibrionaceae bacterium]|tara:strand:+ start:183 stop:716 length:534 start_codon:yes stop_codon:yes gene_type:complete